MLIPCIDLQDGQAVQLVHGRKRELAIADPMSLLLKFKKYKWLHVIDLDAAMGKGNNKDLVRKLCREAATKFGKSDVTIRRAWARFGRRERQRQSK